MAELPAKLPPALIRSLLGSRGLRRVDARAASACAARNDDWEDRLLRRADGYLRDYDLLFRRVTRCLLAQGLEVGEHHPHRTLSAVLAAIGDVPVAEIEIMIRHRHALKYDPMTPPDPQALLVLRLLLARFQPWTRS